mmetsp:Transcript_23326/g.40541  ORF Transcript_23326/g.40541 Transcript_23326/m.40541 type:complete len:143 (-) Transcript_23326:4414-4842(-)
MSKELLKEWIEDGWLKGNQSTIDKILPAYFSVPDFSNKESFPKSDFAELVSLFRRVTGPGQINLKNLIEDPPWFAAKFLLTSRPPENAGPVKIDVMLLAKFEDGVMTEHHTAFDYFSLFSQLGQLPPNAMEHCLTGERLTWI